MAHGVVPIAMVSILLLSSHAWAQKERPALPSPLQMAPLTPPNCADLVAERIEASLVSRSSHPAKGTVRIVGVARNRGGWPALGRVRIALSDSQPYYGTGPYPLAIEYVRDVRPNQELKIQREISWDARTGKDLFLTLRDIESRQGEPPECDAGNNQTSRKGSDVSALFGPGPFPPIADLRLKGSKPVAAPTGSAGLEATLQYIKDYGEGRVSAAVEAPYAGSATPVTVPEGQGTAKLVVQVQCSQGSMTGPPVKINYALGTTGGSLGPLGSIPSITMAETSQTLAYKDLCGPRPAPTPKTR